MTTSYTFTGTPGPNAQVTTSGPTPVAPFVVAVTGPMFGPGPTGTRVHVTGVALLMSPRLPSLTSTIDAFRLNAGELPPGANTRMAIALFTSGVMTVSSLLTVSVPVPELFA